MLSVAAPPQSEMIAWLQKKAGFEQEIPEIRRHKYVAFCDRT
jgi:hypothetical protein